MKLPDIPRAAVVFSLKSFAAGLLALYIALRFGLDNPAWAVVTAYVAAQPHAGATVSKSVYRLIGTFIGACMAVLLVPPLVQAPLLLGLAIAAWIGLCVVLQILDRTARGYMFALAGYTSSIIVFPILAHPDDVFVQASSRFVEIGIGIVCSSVVHAVVFPVSTTKMLRTRLDATLKDARAMCSDAFASDDAPKTAQDRQKLAAAINELYDLLVHARFEGVHSGAQTRAIQAILAQAERLIPLSLAVADRIAETVRHGELPAALHDFLHDAQQAIGTRQDNAVAALIARCDSLRPPLGANANWQQILQCNLLERAADLLRVHAGCVRLREALDNDDALALALAPLYIGRGMQRHMQRHMERDWRGALGAGLATLLTVFLGNALWIASGWEAGASAAMMAGVYFAVYSNTPDPSLMLKNKFNGVVMRVLLGALYVVMVLPALDGFGAMALALAPALIASGTLMGIPRYSALGFNLVVGIMSPNVVDRSFHAELPVYLNSSIATLIGIYFAMVMVSATRFLWVDGMVRRTLQAGRRDIAELRYLDGNAQAPWRSRMTHRIGLLVPRMATAAGTAQGKPMDAVRDMMVGAALAQLHAVQENAVAKAEHATIINEVAAHYRRILQAPDMPPSPALREHIDACIVRDLHAAHANTAPLLALGSLRRNLYPDEHSAPAGLA